MRNIPFMEVFQGDANLMHDLSSLAFRERSVRTILNSLKEFSTLHTLHYDQKTFSTTVSVFKDVYDIYDV